MMCVYHTLFIKTLQHAVCLINSYAVTDHTNLLWIIFLYQHALSWILDMIGLKRVNLNSDKILK